MGKKLYICGIINILKYCYMRSGINYVLVEMDIRDRYMGMDLVISDGGKDFSPESYVSVCGVVVGLPEVLRSGVGMMEWECSCDVELGDRVWIEYHEVLMAMGRRAYSYQEHPDERFIDEGGIVTAIIRYDKLYYAKRGGEVVMLNDYVMVEPLKEEVGSSLILPPVKVIDRAKVLHVGNPVRYINDKYRSAGVGVGDTVLFRRFSLRVSGNDLYEGNSIVQGRYIIGRIV